MLSSVQHFREYTSCTFHHFANLITQISRSFMDGCMHTLALLNACMDNKQLTVIDHDMQQTV